MVQRVFGPVRGAGVQITEKQGLQPIEPGALGQVGYAGLFEKGDVGKLIQVPNKAAFAKKLGGYIDGSQAPDAAVDFFDVGRGAGGLWAIRVTDGNEVQASISLKARRLANTPVMTVKAKNGGRWGGKYARFTGAAANSGKITNTALTTDLASTWKTDQLKGGFLELEGVAGKKYPITGNTSAGVISVAADSKMKTDLAAGVAATGSIVTVDGNSLLDGEHFILNDGVNPAVTFEFDDNGSVIESSTLRQVIFAPGDSIDLVRDRMISKINSAPVLNITASIGGAGTVSLVNDLVGTAGNQAITETVSNVGFLKTGMSGGAAGSSDLVYYVSLDNDGKALAVRVRDGEEKPDTEFALDVYVDGEKVDTYPNLSMDPASARYFLSTINDDDGNDEIVVTDDYSGDHTTADVRPANHYGEIATVTATVLTAVLFDMARNSPGGGNATFALGATNDTMLAQVITLTFSSATAFTAASSKFGALGSGVLGTPFASPNKWTPGFTATAGGSPMANTDTMVVNYKPFTPDDLVGGDVFPDKVNAPRTKFRIVANDHSTLTVAPGSDMTAVGATNDEFVLSWSEDLSGGRDGNADVTDSHYVNQGFDTSSSPFNQFRGKNLGLVKLACPGVTSTTVQQAGIAYAEAKNHQFRVEVPSNIVTEQSAEDYLDNTIGRSNYAVTEFPSYGYVPDPTGKAGLKLTTLTGQTHGMEASIAKGSKGYHQAEAGSAAKLPKVQKLPTGDKVLDEEFMNPLGINVVKKVKGNFVVFGDRTLSVDAEWRFKHQRELMSYYEQVFAESFDDIVFAINDPVEQKSALTILRAFFIPEFDKRAITGKNLDEAAVIKVDSENNTPATEDDGDLIADVSLRLANTVERFRIRMSKQGLFELTG